MNLDAILRNRYHIQQTLGSQQIGAIALSIYLAENLELPVTPKPLCVIYCWQITEPNEHGFQHEAIATKLYEIGQNYTLAPKVQAFFNDDDYYCVVREYLEGYAYLDEFNQEFGEKFKQVGNDPNLLKPDHKTPQDSDISTLKALPIAKSLVKSIAQIPIKLNRRQLLINIGSAIAGFSLAVFLERLKPQPKPIVIVESPQTPEPPSDPLKRGDKAFRDDFGNGLYLEMVRIPSGKFMLGAPPNEIGKRDNETPLVEVQVAAFYIAKFAVTQEQWVTIIGNNPAHFRESLQAPMENISWIEAQDFCRRLTARSPHAYAYRLPSEAEWEYACRAGTNTAYHFGDSPAQLADYAWFVDNSNKRSQPIGQKVPNPWGLYEMHGGVWEWCEDAWHDNFKGTPADGSAWIEGNSGRRVRKGGSWSNEAKLCRSASRDWHWQGDRYNDIGFRVVISAI
ncbi:formylglycine-generating enzyme family protein [Pseudanabaena yagii]|uniref:Formylglycine-generating enzyme family protein n=1 Tax=Pseudanabaena yagii GIHE-NHR1 TaxID=2722753 RepID=A0ABX1LNM5_9CYAN|nr:formylglycine-generating enzyme family protein [Pseudanabaena yagii]NMF57115.1 formylglycine-generating enzyme family protein [Pseudanabaena yagii GIHE-NHR1]